MSVKQSKTDLIDDYLTREKQLKSENTYHQRRKGLNRFQEWLEDTERGLDEIGPQQIEKFIFSLSDQGYAPKTIYAYFSAVRMFYQFLSDNRDYIEENPIEDLDTSEFSNLMRGAKKTKKTEIVYVTPEEVRRLEENVSDPKLRNQLIIRLLFQTGVRRHELVNIELNDIDREDRTIQIRSEKTDSSRRVYYQPDLDLLLKKWIDDGFRDSYQPAPESSYLLLGNRNPQLTGGHINKIVNKAAQNAGIQEILYKDAGGNKQRRITAHTLRHGHAVHSLKSGIDIRWVQEHLGHNDIETTQKYLQVLDDDVRDAYTKFESI